MAGDADRGELFDFEADPAEVCADAERTPIASSRPAPSRASAPAPPIWARARRRLMSFDSELELTSSILGLPLFFFHLFHVEDDRDTSELIRHRQGRREPAGVDLFRLCRRKGAAAAYSPGRANVRGPAWSTRVDVAPGYARLEPSITQNALNEPGMRGCDQQRGAPGCLLVRPVGGLRIGEQAGRERRGGLSPGPGPDPHGEPPPPVSRATVAGGPEGPYGGWCLRRICRMAYFWDRTALRRALGAQHGGVDRPGPREVIGRLRTGRGPGAPSGALVTALGVVALGIIGWPGWWHVGPGIRAPGVVADSLASVEVASLLLWQPHLVRLGRSQVQQQVESHPRPDAHSGRRPLQECSPDQSALGSTAGDRPPTPLMGEGPRSREPRQVGPSGPRWVASR